MLPPAPTALVRPADSPQSPGGAAQAFEAWVAREAAKGVPLWNPWKPRPAAAPPELPGATVVVWGDYPPLETETQEVLRLTVAWIIANRFNGQALSATPDPPQHPTGNWLVSHPGGNRIPGAVPLGWSRRR